LRPGDKIPSVRKVSQDLGVSVNTVFQAYANLEAKGLILAKPRSGYVINNLPATLVPAEERNVILLPSSVEVTTMAAMMMKNAKENGIINFSILAPVNDLLPISKLNKYVASALNDTRHENYQYPLIDGHSRLLQQIALRTFKWEQSIDQTQILVTNGCMEAVNLCLDALTKPGDIVAVESPTYHGILQSLELRGLKAVEIGISPQTGLNLDSLRSALDTYNIAACVFMPSCNNPTGYSMPEPNKIELVNLLGQRGIPLIEDDALGELHYQEGIFPAKAYDQHDNVLYCSSFSKTLAPGFRIGWVSAGKYHGALEKLKFGSNISTNSVLQDAIGRFLESGQYDKHLRKMRLAIQSQMMRYLAVVSDCFPEGTKLSLPHGGLSAWIQLPDGTDAFALQKNALKQGIGICPGHIFSTSDLYHHYIRLNFCPLWSPKIEKGIRTLAEII
jgi:DNA-binding transcriptional MocR family regulator